MVAASEPRNPGGHASYGALVKVNGLKVWETGVYVGYGDAMSNNVAEYSGLAACLEWVLAYLLEHRFTDTRILVRIRGDSKLCIYHLSPDPEIGRKWKVNGGRYYPYYVKAKRLLESVQAFTTVYFTWIPRDENSECDRLSKGRLHERGIKFRIQPEVVHGR